MHRLSFLVPEALRCASFVFELLKVVIVGGVTLIGGDGGGLQLWGRSAGAGILVAVHDLLLPIQFAEARVICLVHEQGALLPLIAVLEVVLDAEQVRVVIFVLPIEVANRVLIEVPEELVLVMHVRVRDHARHLISINNYYKFSWLPSGCET